MIKRSLEQTIYGALNSELKQVALIFTDKNPILLREIVNKIATLSEEKSEKIRSTTQSIIERSLYPFLIGKERVHGKEKYGAESKYYLTDTGEKATILAKFMLIKLNYLSEKYKKDFPSYELIGSSGSAQKKIASVERKKIIKAINKGADYTTGIRKITKIRNLDHHLSVLKKADIIEYESMSIGEEKGGDEIISLDKNGEIMRKMWGELEKSVLKKDILNIIKKRKILTLNSTYHLLNKRRKSKILKNTKLDNKNLRSRLKYQINKLENENFLSINILRKKPRLQLTEKGENFEKKIRLFGKNIYIMEFRKKMLDILHKNKEISTMFLLEKLNESYDKNNKKNSKMIENMLYYAIKIFRNNNIIKSKKFYSTKRSYIRLTNSGKEYVEDILPKIENVIDEICEKGDNEYKTLNELKTEIEKYSQKELEEIMKKRLSVYSYYNVGTKRLPEGEKKEAVFEYIKEHLEGVRPRDLKSMFVICPQRILKQLKKERRIKTKREGKKSLYFLK